MHPKQNITEVLLGIDVVRFTRDDERHQHSKVLRSLIVSSKQVIFPSKGN